MTPVRTSAKEHRAHGTEKDWRPPVRIAPGKGGGRDSVPDTHRGNGRRGSGDTALKSPRRPQYEQFPRSRGTRTPAGRSGE